MDAHFALYERANFVSSKKSSSPQPDDHIIDIRKLLNEQNNYPGRMNKNSSNDSLDEFELPIRRYTPLPDIPRSEDVYYRTESRLGKESKQVSKTSSLMANEGRYFLGDTGILPVYKPIASRAKETRYHFGSSSNKINHSHRLPALEKQINHSLPNTMDLDEDLPMNPVCLVDQTQRNVYTSPGDRIISPIKRPQAPSPPSSAFRRKTEDVGVNFEASDSDSDNDFIE